MENTSDINIVIICISSGSSNLHSRNVVIEYNNITTIQELTVRARELFSIVLEGTNKEEFIKKKWHIHDVTDDDIISRKYDKIYLCECNTS